MIFQRIQAFKHPVMKVLLAQLVPDVFDRVEFWSVGRKLQKVDILW